jgi:exodeoxyribonuclease-5
MKDKKIVDIGVLNEDQSESFEKLRDYISSSSDDIYVLKGWAGTGKTFTISVLVRYVLEVMYPNKKYKIAVTGPTNKSVRVIRKTSGIKHPRVIFQTIHKLLGLTERITLDGKQEFVNQGTPPQIDSVRLLIIDEVSMLNDDLFEMILEYRGKTKIICMGDPAQIPPVGRPDCIPFREELYDKYRIHPLQLRTIMRQNKGNPIIDISVKIRQNIESRRNPVEPVTTKLENDEGVEFLNLNEKETRLNFPSFLERYFKTKKFENNSEYAKIIAWRNKTVASMNQIVRRVIFGEDKIKSKILIGEKLIANSPIIEGEFVLFNTNDEFTVDSFEILKEKKKDQQGLELELKYYEAVVTYLDDQDELKKAYIDILHEDSEEDFRWLLNDLKSIAIEKKGKDKSWIKYYEFMRRFADVGYGYAITCHKAQGSTYDTTFVLEDDIDMNMDIVERNRIKYTSYTRSSRKLYVLRRF